MSAAALALDPDIGALARELDRRGLGGAPIAFVLGSGLGAFAERLTDARRVEARELAALPQGRVPGHAGAIVAGDLAGARVLVQQGRVHLYEGFTAREAARAVRAFCELGARVVVLTNAAGSLRREWGPGTLMRIDDHVNLQGRTPLARAEAAAGPVWDVELGRALEGGARDAGVALQHGVYGAVPGPSYETPAEIRWLARFGVDAVGMSTACEALAARASGARVCGVSLLANLAAGLKPTPLAHTEVVAAGAEASERFSALLEAATRRLAQGLAGP